MSEQKEVVSINPIIDKITFTPDILEIKPIKEETITEKNTVKDLNYDKELKEITEEIENIPIKSEVEDDNTENYFTIFGTILITSGLGYLFC